MLKKRILIFYDHFYPAYKAGGPTQSLVNLVRELYEVYDFHIVCKPHEMGESKQLDAILLKQWNEWENKAKVYYWQYGWTQRTELKQLIQEVAPDVVYVNGLYSLYFNFLPLFYAVKFKRQKPHLTIVLSARGMLHPGALSQKAFKKKIYLHLFRLLNIHRTVRWHATDQQELQFIQTAMGKEMIVKAAANFPNLLDVTDQPVKKAGSLIMGTVALISPMKNHLEVLKALQQLSASVEWHIFGPVKVEAYWKSCELLIQAMPKNIKVFYHGELPPHLLSKAMAQFQVFIMPSKSENFGHAIVEALSAGKPVITTTTTPFTDLEQFNCGFALSLESLQEGLQQSITTFAEMGEDQFAKAVAGTAHYIDQKIEKASLKKAYCSLFEDRIV